VVSVKLATQLAAAHAFIMLTLRPTGLSLSAYRDWLDYVVVEEAATWGASAKTGIARPIRVGFGRSVYRI
jgi:hypothetical protein